MPTRLVCLHQRSIGKWHGENRNSGNERYRSRRRSPRYDISIDKVSGSFCDNAKNLNLAPSECQLPLKTPGRFATAEKVRKPPTLPMLSQAQQGSSIRGERRFLSACCQCTPVEANGRCTKTAPALRKSTYQPNEMRLLAKTTILSL